MSARSWVKKAILGQPYGGMLRRSEGGQWVRHRHACEDPAAASAAAAAEEVPHAVTRVSRFCVGGG